MNDGLVLATFDALTKRYMRFIDATKMVPFSDSLSTELADGLLNFGMEVIKPSMWHKQDTLKNKALNKILWNRKIMTPDKALFIDSGGFQILGGYVPLDYMKHLIRMYTDFIVDTKDVDELYNFYLDINPVKGITPDFAIGSMLEFQRVLEEKTKDNDQKSRVYAVYHCNTPLAQKVFLKYFDDYKIPERLGSHRYAVGGMVPINFNSERMQIKTYMYPLFEVIDRERERLNDGKDVWYHLLGVSSYYEMFLLIWCRMYFKSIGWNLHITFDSSTPLTKAVMSGFIFHVSDKKIITMIKTKYDKINEKPKCKQANLEINAWYMEDIIRKIKENLIIKSKFKLDTVDDCFKFQDKSNTKRIWSDEFGHASIVYQFWSYSQMYKIFEESCMKEPEIIDKPNGDLRYQHMLSHLEEFMYIHNHVSFNRRTYRALNNSFEYLISFVEKKIDLQTLRNMCVQDVSEYTRKLSYKHDLILE